MLRKKLKEAGSGERGGRKKDVWMDGRNEK